jgi:hypothetical protein
VRTAFVSDLPLDLHGIRAPTSRLRAHEQSSEVALDHGVQVAAVDSQAVIGDLRQQSPAAGASDFAFRGRHCARKDAWARVACGRRRVAFCRFLSPVVAGPEDQASDPGIASIT